MDSQPDFKQLSEVFITTSTLFDTASREIARIPNVPTFNEGQRLFEAINGLTTTIESKFTTLEAKFTTLEAKFTTLEAKFTTLEATIERRFSKLEDRMNADAENHEARLYNSHITSRETSLKVLHNRQNVPVDGFPVNPAALMRLTNPALSTLYNAYGLQAEGNLEVKRRRFREFVGLVSDA